METFDNELSVFAEHSILITKLCTVGAHVVQDEEAGAGGCVPHHAALHERHGLVKRR